MEKIQNMKKRLTIIACIMGALVVALAGTLIGVLASSSQSLGSSFSISYNIGENIAAKMRAKKDGVVQTIFQDANYSATFPQDEEGYVDFDTTTSDSVQPCLMEDSIGLTPDNPSFTVVFDIVNISNTTPIRVDLTTSADGLNVKCYIKGGNRISGETDSEGYAEVTESSYYDWLGEVGRSNSEVSIKLVATIANVNMTTYWNDLSVRYTLQLSNATGEF